MPLYGVSKAVQITNLRCQHLIPKLEIYSYLQFYQKAFQFSGQVGSSHGMRSFIGTWTIKIIIDDDYVGSGNFEVLC